MCSQFGTYAVAFDVHTDTIGRSSLSTDDECGECFTHKLVQDVSFGMYRLTTSDAYRSPVLFHCRKTLACISQSVV